MALIDESPISLAPAPTYPIDPTRSIALVENSSSHGVKWIPALFLSGFAALLASFPARNSDLWMHLAAGRDLFQGKFSANSVVSSLAGRPALSGWIYDLLVYGLYSLLGDRGLVCCKVLVVVATALLLLKRSRIGSGWLIPTACSALALLVMSTRMLLQPVTVSYLLLAAGLLIVDKEEGRQREKDWLPAWSLLLLFVLWANLDSWFVLGLGAVALTWLGSLLDNAGTQAASSRLAMLASSIPRMLVCCAILAGACLLNPIHVRAFTVPAGLWSTSMVGGQVTSPFQAAYLANLGQSTAGLAYFPLLGLGLLSFGVNRPNWRWKRFLPWLGLALLSALQARVIPFFAIVAGPVLAWNLDEFFVRHSESAGSTQPRRRLGFVVRSFLIGIACAIFLVSAWPGWLQSPPFEPRHWAFDLPPSLARGATTARQWHHDGRLDQTSVGLHLSPETAYAFAWYCPEERNLLDLHLASALRGDPGAPAEWEPLLRSAGINHVVVYDSDRNRLLSVLDRLLAEPAQWPLLYLEGDLAVFGWRDPLAASMPDSFKEWELNLDRLAFQPVQEARAPWAGPMEETRPRRWWDVFWQPAPPRPIERDEAALHLLHAEALRRSAPSRHLAAWEASSSAGLVGAALSWNGPGAFADAHLRLVLLRPPLQDINSTGDSLSDLPQLALTMQQGFTLRRDDTPPALLYLAIRAARRALAANPDDAQAALVLGESYLRLLHSTRERSWRRYLPQLVQLRHAQASAAFVQALSVNPKLAQAHLNLGAMFGEQRYLDLSLQHRRAVLQLGREAGPPSGVSTAQFREQLAVAEKEISDLASTVVDQERSFMAESNRLRVLDRARLALEKGLVGKAREILLGSDVAAFGPQGMQLELELLLRTGRPKEVRQWTSPELMAGLGPVAYHWLRAQAFAAAGDYAKSVEECDHLARALARAGPGEDPRLRAMMTLGIGQATLDACAAAGSAPALAWAAFRQGEFSGQVTSLVQSLRKEADVAVLRGLLALEAGDVDQARAAFRSALALWGSEAAAASGSGLDFSGRIIAEDCLSWLQ